MSDHDAIRALAAMLTLMAAALSLHIWRDQ